MNFGQILVYLITNISNMYLVGYWRLETISRPFYDFNEIAKYWHLSNLTSWYLTFLILPYSPFQKTKYWKLDINGYWIIGAGC